MRKFLKIAAWTLMGVVLTIIAVGMCAISMLEAGEFTCSLRLPSGWPTVCLMPR